MPADPATTSPLEGNPALATTGTDEALLPADIFEIAATGLVIRKPVEKLIPGSWVITPRDGHFGLIGHHYILYDVELKG